MNPRAPLAHARRLVVKLGSNVVTHDGVELALGRIHALIEAAARLRRDGKDIVLVSSGAVALGMRSLGLDRPPRSLGLRQACAAIGQGRLMSLYTQAFAQLGVTAAQVLVTQEDFADRDRALCIRTTLMRLLELGTVPILNENDSVSVRELIEYRATQAPEALDSGTVAFGDNDGLSARIAIGLDADLLVLLSDVNGLHTGNPKTDPHATRVHELTAIDAATLAWADGGSSVGTGGMASKLAAARLAREAGIDIVIASGAEPHVLERVLAGDDIGTMVVSALPRSDRRKHIAVRGARRGALIVNEGALQALAERKASLLPIGVVAVDGDFERGELVEIRDGSGRVYGRGLVNYDADACRALAGHHSDEIAAILGWRGYDALVTRDNLVLGDP